MNAKICCIFIFLFILSACIPGRQGYHTTLPTTGMGRRTVLPTPTAPVHRERQSTISIGMNLTYLGQYGGGTNGVDIQGNYAYIGIGSRLAIVDISNSQQPDKVGETSPLGGLVTEVVVLGDYAYIAANEAGLRIADVRDPTNPFEVGHLITPDHVVAVAVEGSYAYLANQHGGLRIVEVSTPSNPIEIKLNYRLSSASHLAVNEKYLYVVGETCLTVIDKSDPLLSFIVGAIDIGESAETIVLSGNYAYLPGKEALHIVDITMPAGMTDSRKYYIADSYAIAIVRKYAILSVLNKGIVIYDLSKPLYPQEIGKISVPHYLIYDSHLAADGNYAYFTDGYGLRIIDLNLPNVPREVGSYESNKIIIDVAIDGNYAYVAEGDSGLRIIDVSDPADPKLVGSFEGPASAERKPRSHKVEIRGHYAFIVNEAGLIIIDVIDPGSPTQTAIVKTVGSPIDFTLEGNTLYLLDEEGLRIIDASVPSHPIEVKKFALEDWLGIRIVFIAGDYGYLVGENGSYYFDVRTLAKPKEIDKDSPYYPHTFGSYVNSIETAGNRAYSLGLMGHLTITDLTTPGHPTIAGSCYTELSTYGLAVTGHYAYVAASWPPSLLIFDVSRKPCETYSYSLPLGPNKVAVDKDRVYIAALYNGLVILEFNPPVIHFRK